MTIFNVRPVTSQQPPVAWKSRVAFHDNCLSWHVLDGLFDSLVVCVLDSYGLRPTVAGSPAGLSCR